MRIVGLLRAKVFDAKSGRDAERSARHGETGTQRSKQPLFC